MFNKRVDNSTHNMGHFRFTLQSVLSIFLVIFLTIACGAVVVFLSVYLSRVPVASAQFDPEAFVIIVGILFTFASLIVSLFGIINYFQSADALRRLTELEVGFSLNAREVIVMKVFLTFLSNRSIMTIFQNTKMVNNLIVHLYNIADSKDLEFDNNQSIFEIEVSFVEILKIAGLNVCKEMLILLDTQNIYKSQYSVCISNFKSLIRYYEKII
jgi:hypothetical protein